MLLVVFWLMVVRFVGEMMKMVKLVMVMLVVILLLINLLRFS